MTLTEVQVEWPKPTPLGWVVIVSIAVALIVVIAFLIFKDRNPN